MKWAKISNHYSVSTTGLVRDDSNNRILGQWLNNQGYALVRLSKPRMISRVHRLVATAFCENKRGLPCVNHLDFNRSNNNYSNLEWCTQLENLKYSRDNGRMQTNYWKGKRSPNAALTDETAKQIRIDYSSGKYSWSCLGKKFGISKRSVGRIVSGESYVEQMAKN